MGRAEFCGGGSDRLARNNSPVPPVPHDLPFGGGADRNHVALDPERAKCFYGVGTKSNACADLAEAWRLLVYDDLESAAMQRERGSESADPAADDSNP